VSLVSGRPGVDEWETAKPEECAGISKKDDEKLKSRNRVVSCKSTKKPGKYMQLSCLLCGIANGKELTDALQRGQRVSKFH
jgi:hypothetical protein